MADPTFGITITRVDGEPRPARLPDMSTIGLIGTAPAASADTKATLAIPGPTNGNINVTAKGVGALGNGVSVALVNPGTANAVLGVVVTGSAIVVNLATSAASAVTSTAAQVVAAIVAATSANALVTVVAGGTGAGVVVPMAATLLTGGRDEPFPLNVPVLITSDDTAMVDALGLTGTLRDSILLINAQLGEFQSAAKIVVVRVADGGTESATITNIVGNGTTTGLSAFLDAAARTGTTPRLLIAPGFTWQRTPPAANAVCAALPPICERLLAHAIVGGPGTSQADAISWRETMNSQRLIPVDPFALVFANGVSVQRPLVPAIAGIAVRRDAEFGGRPFHSWANQPVQGIVGPSRNIRFNLTDDATEGQLLLAKNVGIVVRGEAGVSGSIADGGFVYIGTDNVGADDLWRFYNVTRGRDFIHLALLDTVKIYLGRFNITGQTVQAIVNTMNGILRDLKAEGDILGYEVKFVPQNNSPEGIRSGKLSISFAAEEAPVLRSLGIRSARMRTAVEDFIANLAA